MTPPTLSMQSAECSIHNGRSKKLSSGVVAISENFLLRLKISLPHPGRFSAAALMIEKFGFEFLLSFLDRSAGFGESAAFVQQFFEFQQSEQLDLGSVFG